MLTIILPVSRRDYLKRVFAGLELLECDAEKTNLVVYLDGDMELYDIANNHTVQSKFKGKKCIFRRKGLPNVGSIHRRRQRIADIHNELKEIDLVKNSEYIFMVEDDTIFNPNTLKKLMDVYLHYPFAGLVTGVQIGRWGYTHIGAWRFDDVYDTKIVESIGRGEGVQEIDASGMYCCLTKTTTYIKHTFAPYDEILGPDVEYGICLRTEGHKNYINFAVNCLHLTKRGEIKVFDTPIQRVRFEKQKDINAWVQTVIEEGV